MRMVQIDVSPSSPDSIYRHSTNWFTEWTIPCCNCASPFQKLLLAEYLLLGAYRHHYDSSKYSVIEAGWTVTSVQEDFWNVTFATFTTLTSTFQQACTNIKRYLLPAIFRAPPEDPSVSYTLYTLALTSRLVLEQ